MRLVLGVMLALALVAGCRYSYLAETPLVLAPCESRHLAEPRVSSAFALVTALESNLWTVLRVSPEADVVEAHYCRRGGKVCTMISATIATDGAIDVLRIEPTTDISRRHYRILRRWMGRLKHRHQVLRCYQGRLDDFREAWKLHDPDAAPK
jgi:hypothetical protein